MGRERVELPCKDVKGALLTATITPGNATVGIGFKLPDEDYPYASGLFERETVRAFCESVLRRLDEKEGV